MVIGLQIREARERAQLSKQSLARKLGTQSRVVERHELGVGQEPTLAELRDYAKVLGCTLVVRLENSCNASV